VPVLFHNGDGTGTAFFRENGKPDPDGRPTVETASAARETHETTVKRLLSIGLLALLLYNTVGYYAFFAMFQHQAKHEMKALIKSRLPEQALMEFRFASAEEARTALDWIHEREFRHAGHLYDVVRQHVDAATGAVTYLVLADHQEQHLLAQLAQHTRHQADPGTQPGQHGLHWLEHFTPQGDLPPGLVLPGGPVPARARFAAPPLPVATVAADPATPPPRLT
jgi:hypothetical protein